MTESREDGCAGILAIMLRDGADTVHELAITQSIVESVAERLPDAQVTCVRLVVGQLSGASVDAIRFCFDLVTQGTNLAGAGLVVEEPEGRMRCRRCGAETVGANPFAICRCGGTELDLVAGTELLVRSVEVLRHV